MMALVEQDSSGGILARPGGIDHDESVVGDDDVRLPARPLGAFDEAAAVMRAAGVNAFAAPVGERRRSRAAEQARKPAGQVAANHVSVLGIGGPSADELGEDRRPARESALKRVLEVQQAEVVFA